MLNHTLLYGLPLKRSVTGLEVFVAEMVAVVTMTLDEEVKRGEEEGDGEDWGAAELKQASSGLLFSSVIMLKRSRPEDAALALPSEGAKGSLGEQGVGLRQK